ncbi:hypothetical protein [Sphingomonas sp.]|uniref:hypothetical protein n=1 Tax=Sphingomonas sp. TaxID=28214 RepID=UPI0025EF961C|nr:hypothetical protein [Sphingomonas sp.]
MSEGINQPNSTDDSILDGGDRTEELTQAQQAGYGNKGGLDQKVENANITGGSHSGGVTAGSAAGATDGASGDLAKADPTAPEKSGFSSTQGDGPNSQSGASAGSGGMGQRT